MFLEVKVFQKGLFRASPLQLMTYRLSVMCIGFHWGRDFREMESPITTRLFMSTIERITMKQLTISTLFTGLYST